MALVTAAYAVGWLAFVAVGDRWSTLLAAVFLAAVFGQVAHDVGHRQVFRRSRSSALIASPCGSRPRTTSPIPSSLSLVRTATHR
ncbi:hypothetical protein ACIBI8_15515 [Streptomyces sp. NPDC050529]|uniref:hypothetical protein n=1 Tax=Streptomyces sp. NPDC050529 TaxID=3365624 RepID=UPI0037B95606